MPNSENVSQEHAVEISDDASDGGWQQASEVGTDVARAAWAEAAREVLLVAAGSYQTVVTYKELAAEVQQISKITTTQPMHYWIGDVLTRVATECGRRDEPLLSALCVNAAGSVGEGYALAVQSIRGELPADPDLHAAAERLECHRHVGASDLPADGGKAALTARLKTTRDRERKVRIAEAPIATCPKCYMAIPSTGLCDNCD